MSSGHRRAALALHSLTRRDCRLILAELPAADQAILRGHLAELAELGFVGSHGDLEFPPPTSAATRTPSTPAAQLREAGAAPVFEILSHEPATLIAHFLALERWPWAPDFLDLLPPARRALVRNAMDRPFVAASSRDSFLLDTVAAALGTEGAQPLPVRQPLVPTLFERIKTWKR